MWSRAEGISSYFYVNRFRNSYSGAHQSLPTTPPLQASRNLCAATTRGAHGGDMDNVLGKCRIHRCIWSWGSLSIARRGLPVEKIRSTISDIICLASTTCWEVDNDFLHFQLLTSSKADCNEAVNPNRQSWQGCTAVRYCRNPWQKASITEHPPMKIQHPAISESFRLYQPL